MRVPRRQVIQPRDSGNLNGAFALVCSDLGIPENARHSRETVAMKIFELAGRHRDPEALRAAVVASLNDRA
jgi:hypothetical protein